MSEWISVKDQEPPKDTKILCFYDGYIDVLEYWYDEVGEKVFFNPPIANVTGVSHWMPLPKPPEDENKCLDANTATS